MAKICLTAMWSDKLRDALIANLPEFYEMQLFRKDAEAAFNAVNQGIDFHLEACLVPARGDTYSLADGRFKLILSRESMVVLVRRLITAEDDWSHDLATSICSTADIELV